MSRHRKKKAAAALDADGSPKKGKHHKNAGDRHKDRKANRIKQRKTRKDDRRERHKKNRDERHQRHLENLDKKKGNKSFLDSVGDIAGKIFGPKADGLLGGGGGGGNSGGGSADSSPKDDVAAPEVSAESAAVKAVEFNPDGSPKKSVVNTALETIYGFGHPGEAESAS